jgi:hypothetical protein
MKNQYTFKTIDKQTFKYVGENLEIALDKFRSEEPIQADNIINIAVNIGCENKPAKSETPIQDIIDYLKMPSVTRQSVLKYAEKLLSLENNS